MVRSLCNYQPYLYLRTAVVNVSAAYFFGFVKAMHLERSSSHCVDEN